MRKPLLILLGICLCFTPAFAQVTQEQFDLHETDIRIIEDDLARNTKDINLHETDIRIIEDDLARNTKLIDQLEHLAGQDHDHIEALETSIQKLSERLENISSQKQPESNSWIGWIQFFQALFSLAGLGLIVWGWKVISDLKKKELNMLAKSQAFTAIISQEQKIQDARTKLSYFSSETSELVLQDIKKLISFSKKHSDISRTNIEQFISDVKFDSNVIDKHKLIAKVIDSIDTPTTSLCTIVRRSWASYLSQSIEKFENFIHTVHDFCDLYENYKYLIDTDLEQEYKNVEKEMEKIKTAYDEHCTELNKLKAKDCENWPYQEINSKVKEIIQKTENLFFEVLKFSDLIKYELTNTFINYPAPPQRANLTSNPAPRTSS